jgi:hypothetical protein
MERAAYFKKLYDKQLDAADSKLSLKERMAWAEEQMDKKAEGWREELGKTEVDMVEIVVEKPGKTFSHDDLKSLYARLQAEGDEAGLGEAPDAPELHETTGDNEECLKSRIAALEEKVAKLTKGKDD